MALKLSNAMLALVLSTLAGVLSYRTAVGQMALYIHPRYELLVYGCAVILICFAAVLWQGDFSPPRFGLLCVLVPLCIAGMVVPKPLGAAALGQQLASLNTVVQAPLGHERTADTTQWNLYDWAVASSVDISPYRGAPAVVEGFVVVNPALALPTDQLMLARYVLKCCTADAGGVGMPVQWNSAASLASDRWIRVTGTIQVVSVDGIPRPLLVADTVTPIEQPDRPYLVP